ncbi:MAG: hypothetical protein MZU91_13515 [Desulfosudis oleivorans]|nr:hypothetical protein [Desulfosudis oleivorans]
MLGLRGVRLGIIMPEIVEMQVRAIFEAACRRAPSAASTVKPEVMIPLTGTRQRAEWIQPRRSKRSRQGGHGGEGHRQSTTSSAR